MSRALLNCRDLAGIQDLVPSTFGGYGTVYAGSVSQDATGYPRQAFSAIGTVACTIAYKSFMTETDTAGKITSRGVYTMTCGVDETLLPRHLVKSSGITFEVRGVTRGETDPSQLTAEIVDVG